MLTMLSSAKPLGGAAVVYQVQESNVWRKHVGREEIVSFLRLDMWSGRKGQMGYIQTLVSGNICFIVMYPGPKSESPVDPASEDRRHSKTTSP
jgi:hypothetical protein